MPYSCPKSGKGAPLKLSVPSSREPSPSSVLDPPISISAKPTPTITPPPTTSQPKKAFYIFNDDDDNNNEDENEPLQALPARSPVSTRATPFQNDNTSSPSSPLKRTSSVRNKQISPGAGGISKLSLNLSEILKFPKESTHAYSYAHLSPNSLAVRLSILKRSLEILLDRPDLIHDGNNKGNGGGLSSSVPLNLDIENFIHQIQDEGQMDDAPKSKLNIRTNASSAALAALFNSSISSQNNSASNSSDDLSQAADKQSIDKNTHLGLKTLINILREDKLTDDSNLTTKKKLAQNLHDLSLTSVRGESSSLKTSKSDDKLDSESQLKIKLLHALATPFYEPIVQTPIISLNRGASTLALSSLEIPTTPTTPTTPSIPFSTTANGTTKRIFHNVSQRNTSPQAVFTVDVNDPWNLKAANDLACLIFGVSRNSLRRLTFLDLISPDSRDFVLNKLIANSLTNNDVIFSGEIIAIAKSGNKLTWASLWAKRKGSLIICMFDQVPCDSVDITIDLDKSNEITSWKKVSGTSGFFGNDKSNLQSLNELIWRFDVFLQTERRKTENQNIPGAILESKVINDQRYFTLRKNGLNIPCAVTSKVLDENEGRLKLKIHSLPYIAGVFIVSSKDFKVLSFNQSISKNLFGLNESLLTNQPITKIIPNFMNIIQFILKSFPNLRIVPGLVLPEHFFRQINALLINKNDQTFLNSIGLDGKHADGSTINIDIQLRCSNVDTIVLWITHSRTVYANRLDSAVKKVRIKLDDTSNEVEEDEDEEGRELPSQLSILDENEIQSISRSSSVRSTINSSPISPVSSSKQSSTSDIKSLNDIKEDQESITSEDDSTTKLSDYKVLDETMDEIKLLKIENETIERQKSKSPQYPKTIGVKRRQKAFKEFKILKKMGQGAYGRVVLAENRKDPNYVVVIKLIIKERILVDTWVRDRKLGTIPSEIQIMATLNNNPHPNIMRLIDFFEDEDYYYIETPQHGFPSPAIDLFDLIELKKSMTEHECKSIIKQSISAINHLHNNGIVHRDIKDENLIIDSNGVTKLIDFGSAAYIRQGPFDVFVGTLDYAAPEVLNGQPYEGKPQDVWSLGILIYTLIYKENPFYNVDEIMEGELNVPFVTSEGCIALIKKILQRDIRKRPKMKDIVEDPWLNI